MSQWTVLPGEIKAAKEIPVRLQGGLNRTEHAVRHVRQPESIGSGIVAIRKSISVLDGTQDGWPVSGRPKNSRTFLLPPDHFGVVARRAVLPKTWLGSGVVSRLTTG